MKRRNWKNINLEKIKTKSFVTIERHRNVHPIHGAILRESQNWILLQNVEEFRIDGYSLVHKIMIKRIRQNAADKVYQYILEKEGIAAKIKDVSRLKIDDATSVLTYLKKIGSPVQIECELIGTWPFSLGFIKDIREDNFDLQYIDVEGKIEKKPRKIRFAHIDRIGFKERYEEIFGKYVKEKGK